LVNKLSKTKPKEDAQKARRDLDRELDLLEAKIEELKILYEQFFVDILTQPPDQLRKEVVKKIKKMLKAPFKNAASRFRLRMLVQRYQSYATYWERVNKQREEGTYFRDVFKADMREKMDEETARLASKGGVADKAFRQLYASYEAAVRKSGKGAQNLNFDAFKKSLMKKAKELKEKHGVKKLHYKIVLKDGKVLVKASGK
jgi:hypothetical protein